MCECHQKFCSLTHLATHSLPHRGVWGRIRRVKETKLMSWISESLIIKIKKMQRQKQNKNTKREENKTKEKQIMHNLPNSHH